MAGSRPGIVTGGSSAFTEPTGCPPRAIGGLVVGGRRTPPECAAARWRFLLRPAVPRRVGRHAVEGRFNDRRQLMVVCHPVLGGRFAEQHGRAPNRAELRVISQLASDLTRQGKDPGEVEYHDHAARWDAQYSGDRARISRGVGLSGPGHTPSGGGARVSGPRARR
jgi:hypothetical protein